MKKCIVVLLITLMSVGAQAGIVTSQLAAPTVGAEDIAQLNAPLVSDTENIMGTGVTVTGDNDYATYVANDRSTQGQTFTMDSAGTVEGIWVKHVLYTDGMSNGTWSGLDDGTQIDIRICSVSDTALAVLSDETVTVAAGHGIPGGGDWGGTGKWLYIDLDNTVDLTTAGLYAFDLTSYGPWFELAGLEAGPYAGGVSYTVDIVQNSGIKKGNDMVNVWPDGDRTFVVDIVPEPTTLALLGLGALALLRRRKS